MGQGEAPAKLRPDLGPPDVRHSFVDVPMPGFQPWTFEEPYLYTAEVSLRRAEQVLDTGHHSLRYAGDHRRRRALQTERPDPPSERIESRLRMELGGYHQGQRVRLPRHRRREK